MSHTCLRGASTKRPCALDCSVAHLSCPRQPRAYYFEGVHLLFKVLICVLIFFNGNINKQLTFALLALLVFSFLSSQLAPYRDPSDDFMWNTCLTSILLSVYLNQLEVAQARVATSASHMYLHTRALNASLSVICHYAG